MHRKMSPRSRRARATPEPRLTPACGHAAPGMVWKDLYKRVFVHIFMLDSNDNPVQIGSITGEDTERKIELHVGPYSCDGPLKARRVSSRNLAPSRATSRHLAGGCGDDWRRVCAGGRRARYRATCALLVFNEHTRRV